MADDLPKEGRYYIHTKEYDNSYLSLFDFGNKFRKLVIPQIDWYLLPLELELPGDEEIKEQYPIIDIDDELSD